MTTQRLLVASVAVVVGAAAVLPIAGCRQVLGVDGYGPKPIYLGKHDGVRYVSESCRDGVDEVCFHEATDCAADPACVAEAQCLAACASDDATCRGTCNLSIPDTKAMRALVACEATHRECADCASSRAVWSGPDCDTCLVSNCPGALEAFSRDLAALEMHACTGECPDFDATCLARCSPSGGSVDGGATVDAGGDRALLEMQACASGPVCQDACGKVTPDWSCLGSVEWPPPAPTLSRLDLHFLPVRVEQDTAPIPNLFVKACSEVGDCATALASESTSPDDGWASLAISRPATGDRFFGHLMTTDPDLAALVYLFPPVRESPSWRKIRLVSRSLSDSTVPNLMAGGGAPIHLDWVNKGGLAWSIVACNRAPAPGVEVTVTHVPAESVLYSGSTPLPDPNAKQTSALGLGVVINVAPGQPTVTARLHATQQIIGTYSVQVRAGSITHMTMVPTPVHD